MTPKPVVRVGQIWGIKYGRRRHRVTAIGAYVIGQYMVFTVPEDNSAEETAFGRVDLDYHPLWNLDDYPLLQDVDDAPTTTREAGADWREWRDILRAPDECACGTKRAVCIYHKEGADG